jgi:hypothetical protein
MFAANLFEQNMSFSNSLQLICRTLYGIYCSEPMVKYVGNHKYLDQFLRYFPELQASDAVV